MVQIGDFLTPESAEWLASTLERATPWRLALSHQGRGQMLKAEAALQGAGADIKSQVAALIQRSGQQYGFIYFNFGMVSAYNSGEPRANHPIHPVTGFLMGEEFAAFGRQLTGDDSIRWADSQATLYRPNDFLGLHDDSASGEVQRVAAYTLGFTSRWRSDWGGQPCSMTRPATSRARLEPALEHPDAFPRPSTPFRRAQVAPYARSARLSIVPAGSRRRDH
jgi:SM-20-related protein